MNRKRSAATAAKTPVEQKAGKAGEVVVAFKGREPIVQITVDPEVHVHVKCKDGEKPLGSDDARFLLGLVSQVINTSSKGGAINKEASDFALSVVQAIDPKDEVEAMLAAQMAAVHLATMAMGQRLNRAETISQQDSAGSLLNKLARTYAAQTEALKRYRSGGEQRITVQHVTVNEGGQAVVGNINNGSKGSNQAGGGDG